MNFRYLLVGDASEHSTATLLISFWHVSIHAMIVSFLEPLELKLLLAAQTKKSRRAGVELLAGGDAPVKQANNRSSSGEPQELTVVSQRLDQGLFQGRIRVVIKLSHVGREAVPRRRQWKLALYR
jgi:hypothetical protein